MAPSESASIQQQLEASGVAQVIVVMRRPPAGAPTAMAAPPADLADKFRSSELSQASALVGLRASLALGGGSPRRRAARPAPPVRVFPNLGVMYGTVDPDGLSALRSDPRVGAVTGAPPLSLIRPVGLRNARPTAPATWGIEALGVTKLWDQGLTGAGVRVAHLDTGVDGRHPALKRAVGAFAEIDFLGSLVTPTPAAHDTDEHGTHTAATIAGRPVRGKSVGVAPGAELASALVIEGGDVVARVLGGMNWAIGQKVKVLSMSLGFRGWWGDFIPVIGILRQAGVLPVIAVGNEGPGTSRSPGNYSDVVSVGAVGEDLHVASFSSSQRFRRPVDPVVPDLVAPGVDVLSAKPGRGWQLMSGTSMATPHVAGVAALLFEAKPSATVDEVEAALFAATKRKDGLERAGRGFPDAVKALRALTGAKRTAHGG